MNEPGLKSRRLKGQNEGETEAMFELGQYKHFRTGSKYETRNEQKFAL